MSYSFLFALMCLGAYRVYRLIGLDEITKRPRGWFTKRTGDWGDLFLTCPWCCGAWVSFATVFVIDHWYVGLPLPVLWGLAVSCVVGLIGGTLDS